MRCADARARARALAHAHKTRALTHTNRCHPPSPLRSIPILPSCCATEKTDLTYAYVLFIFSVVFGVVSLVVEIYTTVTPSADDDAGDDDGGNSTAVASFGAGIIGHVIQRLTAH